MTPEQAKALRAEFPKGSVGKLPRVTCGDCSKRGCQSHKKQKCQVCEAYVSTAHIHLDFVGHALVTDRLLAVDPGWSWEPVAWDERGQPFVSKGAGGENIMWIRLTVGGVTRLGVGSVGAGSFDAEKQLIGDALRNAAMRFGVALDLWTKNELESASSAGEGAPPPAALPGSQLLERFNALADTTAIRREAKAAGLPRPDLALGPQVQAWDTLLCKYEKGGSEATSGRAEVEADSGRAVQDRPPAGGPVPSASPEQLIQDAFPGAVTVGEVKRRGRG